jgi:hypothetical protein
MATKEEIRNSSITRILAVITGRLRKFHSENFRSGYSLINFIIVIILKRIRYEKHVLLLSDTGST